MAQALQEEKLPRRVRRLREERGLTQQALARLSGVSQPTISGIEKGAMPSLDTAQRIAEAMGVGLEELDSRREHGKGEEREESELRARESQLFRMIAAQMETYCQRYSSGRSWPNLVRLFASRNTLDEKEGGALESLAKGLLVMREDAEAGQEEDGT